MTLSGPIRPEGEVRIHRDPDHGAWVVEVHYQGSCFADTVGLRTHQGEALALAQFARVVRADDALSLLDREGDEIAAADAWMRRWADCVEDEQ